jgi:hypothetical protein
MMRAPGSPCSGPTSRACRCPEFASALTVGCNVQGSLPMLVRNRVQQMINIQIVKPLNLPTETRFGFYLFKCVVLIIFWWAVHRRGEILTITVVYGGLHLIGLALNSSPLAPSGILCLS